MNECSCRDCTENIVTARVREQPRDVEARLWVDDQRCAPPGWTWARTTRHAVQLLREQSWDVVSLDHDMGDGTDTREIILIMCGYPEMWPNELRVHSMNPVGRTWLTEMIKRYKPAPDATRRQ